MKIKGEDLENVKNFEKEKDKFYMLLAIADSEKPLLYSDGESYIIGRSELGYPTWIWTKENITPEQLLRLEEELEYFLEEGENKFTAKKELFQLLDKEYETSDYFEMGYLSCKEPLNPLKGKGIFVRPNYADKVTLAEFWRANAKELYQKVIPQNEALEEVELWIEGKKFYVLKDSKGEVVSMAGYSTIGDRAKISHVFTPKEERGKGYCKNLIYCLSKKLKEEGYKPLLYTDYHYKASNEAYKKVGFEDEGILINFKISKEKKKQTKK